VYANPYPKPPAGGTPAEVTRAARQLAPGLLAFIGEHDVPGHGRAPAHGWVTITSVLGVHGYPGLTAVCWTAGTASGVAFYPNLWPVLTRGAATFWATA
jgi:hypothetical protein